MRLVYAFQGVKLNRPYMAKTAWIDPVSTPQIFEVMVGDKVRVKSESGTEITFKVRGFKPPHKPSSSGKVSVSRVPSKVEEVYYVKVIGAKWIEREDQDE